MAFEFRYQPLKGLYWTYTVCSLLIIRLPLWTALYILPSARPRQKWSLGRSLIVSIIRVFVDAMYTTGFDFMKAPPLEKSAGGSEKTGFVWVKATPQLIVGDIARMAEQNEVSAIRTGGFWYGERDTNGKVGQTAHPDEVVFYYLHSESLHAILSLSLASLLNN